MIKSDKNYGKTVKQSKSYCIMVRSEFKINFIWTSLDMPHRIDFKEVKESARQISGGQTF